jgi:CheY-like chemotaxis protein
MGGTVDVESQIDRGSSFWVELAGAAAVPQPAPRLRADHPDLRPQISGTVLYIEDNPSNVRLVERLLRQRRPGIVLLNANSGEGGVTMALQHKPDLIFLDLHLPDTPGEEVLRRWWADPQTRNIPVTVLSADATSSQSRRLMAAGATAYLTKPIDVAQLLERLDHRFLP